MKNFLPENNSLITQRKKWFILSLPKGGFFVEKPD